MCRQATCWSGVYDASAVRELQATMCWLGLHPLRVGDGLRIVAAGMAGPPQLAGRSAVPAGGF